MSTSEFAIKGAQNESIWRERLARHAASGKTIAVFCREENIGKSTLSYWRRRLGVVGARVGHKLPPVATPFVEAGRVNATRWQQCAAPADKVSDRVTGGIELRLELGGGVVLHIARH
jgi:hypothetical protein